MSLCPLWLFTLSLGDLHSSSEFINYPYMPAPQIQMLLPWASRCLTKLLSCCVSESSQNQISNTDIKIRPHTFSKLTWSAFYNHFNLTSSLTLAIHQLPKYHSSILLKISSTFYFSHINSLLTQP